MATRQWIKVGAALAAGTAGMMAQSITAPGSDPVSIARAGAGVAYGRSLEAAGINPALLTTLSEPRSAYVALGIDSQAAFTTLQGNQHKSYSDERNLLVEGLGAAWGLRPGLAFGFRLDNPFRRQVDLKRDSEARFQGDYLSLKGTRLQAQLGWSPTDHPEWSFGAGVGFTRVELELGSTLRAVVPLDPTQPLSATNRASDIDEFQLREKGSKVVPSFTLGARWALNTRWTLGATFDNGAKASVISQASRVGYLTVYDRDGFSAPTVGNEARGNTYFSRTQAQQGSGDFKFPPRLTMGVRQRVNQLFTWEADARVTFGGVQLPSYAYLQTPNGSVMAPGALAGGQGTNALMLMGEVSLGKFWTVRIGTSLESAALKPEQGSPLLPTGSQAAFSVGAGYRVWGGELSVGYEFRNPRKQDRYDLTGDWGQAGFRPTNAVMRYEGVGHLFSLGFRRSF